MANNQLVPIIQTKTFPRRHAQRSGRLGVHPFPQTTARATGGNRLPEQHLLRHRRKPAEQALALANGLDAEFIAKTAI